MALEQRQLANVIRVLSMDAVERARSGHPGAPMGMADIATVLWREFLRHNPANPAWANRDRFVMSNGHGSMLLYAVLHLSGYDLSMDDLKAFRQLHSKTPGHPEYGCAPGVEATTGPLGQGVANAVGMALAERMLAARFNRPEFPLIAHHTYFFAGDGCLMEGISHEACSLAGTLRLGRLIGIYDDNGISIDGEVGGWFGDDTAQRFAAYGWHVQHGVDGHDPEQVRAALKMAVAEDSRPSLICCNTVIGWGAPEKQGTAAAHGAPLGESEWRRARDNLGWTQPPFVVPEEYYQAWDARTRGERLEREWRQCFADYQREYPELAEEFTRRQRGELPAAWVERLRDHVRECAAQAQDMATRKASMHSLTVCASLLPELIGGSADLSESNLTFHQHSRRLSGACMDGNYLHYGVREFAMVAMGNGIALHGGFIPYAGTFLMFSEYARNALRMAALMRLRQIFVFTHDSIGLGEDGPTHQAVEQAACLRLIPNMSVWRPADAAETAVAWQFAVERAEGPTCLLFSRQTVPCVERAADQCELIRRGAYVLVHGGERPELIVIATGSELSLGCAAAQTLSAEGREVRVVSMPSCDVFDSQSQSYRDAVLPPDCRVRIAVEAGIGSYWRRYVGLDGAILGVDAFGESAPARDVFAHFGFTETGLLERCRELLARQDAV